MANAKRLLLLRFGELWLKSFEVQRRFKDRLLTNIWERFDYSGIPAKIICSRDRIFVEVDEADFGTAKELLSRIFGLVSFSPVVKIPAEKPRIIAESLIAAKNSILPKDTFAIRVQRNGRHAFTSNELERECGAAVVAALGNKVKLVNPDKTVYVDVRDSDAYVFSEKTHAPGGLPLGVEGKIVVEASKDFKRDAVAAYLLMKRGCRVFPVFAKDARQKELMARISMFDPSTKPYVASSKNPDKFAIKLCAKKKALGIVLADGLSGMEKKKPKLFDAAAEVAYLYPLVGYADAEISSLYGMVFGQQVQGI